MSSTKRGSKREDSDYYQTPEWIIRQFWDRFKQVEQIGSYALDPCAGGSSTQPMAYPNAIRELHWTTVDIRDNSKAELIADFLNTENGIGNAGYDIVISNPPFCLAEGFIRKAMDSVLDGGFVIFLLRLNFLGGQKRKKLFEELKPKYVFVHSKRPSFTKGKTDSIEYAHFVWQKGRDCDTILEIL